MRLAPLALLASLTLAPAVAAGAPPDWPEDGRALLEPAPPLTDAAGAEEAPLVDLACLTTPDCTPIPRAEAVSAGEPEPTAIPLPAALTLLGAGMATLAMLLRRGAGAG